jgi:hypothetical protein
MVKSANRLAREIPLNSRLRIHVPRDFRNSNPVMQLLILVLDSLGLVGRKIIEHDVNFLGPTSSALHIFHSPLHRGRVEEVALQDVRT